MAEYVEVMEQKRRMCNSYVLCCMGCPLNATNFCNKNTGEKISADFPEVERIVMAWAAEHPEPVYPTWGKWLISIGVINGVHPHGAIDTLGNLNKPIPADIAHKLGMEPIQKEDA